MLRNFVRSARCAAAAAATGLMLSGSAWAAGPGTTTVVDQPSGGAVLLGLGNYAQLDFSGAGSGDAVSGDPSGRWVVFTSQADSLLTTGQDDGGGEHVYELDRQTGIVVPVSLDNAGQIVTAANASVSKDGTKVVFETRARIDAVHDTDDYLDAYVRLLATGQTVLVSRATGAAGTAARIYGRARIDADGDKVAFATPVSLDALDTNAKGDVYVRDLVAQTTTLVSRLSGAGTPAGNGESGEPSLSADGTTVAFTSASTNLDADDANGALRDVFVRSAATTQLVSMRTGSATGGAGDSHQPDLTPSGNTVAFASEASDLVATPSSHRQIFRRQFSVAGTQTLLVSKGSGGASGDSDSSHPSISVVGASVSVAFESTAANLDPAQASGDRADYVADGPAGTVRLISRAAGPAGAPLTGGSASGVSIGSASRTVAYEAISAALTPGSGDFGHVYARDLSDPAEPQITVDHAPGAPGAYVDGAGDAGFDSGGRSMSADGRYVVFCSDADGLLGAPSAQRHAFRRDLRTGETVVVDRADGAGGALGDDTTYDAVISADGRVVAFRTFGSLDPADTNSSGDVYVRDVAAGTTRLASRADGAGGAVGDHSAEYPALSGDGSRVAWSTDAQNLADGDTDLTTDVHLRDLGTGRTILVSRADGATLVKGNGSSYAPTLNADATVVAFSTSATNLADGDADNGTDIHVRDLAGQTTRLASRATGAGGALGNQTSDRPSLSADGTAVAFESGATNLDPADSDGAKDVYVRNLSTGVTTLVSRADGAAGDKGDLTSRSPSVSADGSTIAFESVATNLTAAPLPPPTGVYVTQVYVRDLARATTVLASRADGAAGAPADDARATDAQLNGDGSCVAFVSSARSLALGAGVSSDFVRVYQRTLRGECPFPAPAGPGGGGGGGGGAPGTTPVVKLAKPRLSKVALRFARFRVGGNPTAVAAKKRAPVGTRIDFTLDAPATVALTVTRSVAGKRIGKRCRKPTHALRKRKACVRSVGAGILRRAGVRGANRVAFSGRIARRALPVGSYVLSVRAVNAGGASATVSLRFRIVRR